MTRHAPERTAATLHVDHRKVEVTVERRRPGYAFVWPVRDAGASDRGLDGRVIRRAWDRGQWKELRDKVLAKRMEPSNTVNAE